jgi:hypothetical protein
VQRKVSYSTSVTCGGYNGDEGGGKFRSNIFSTKHGFLGTELRRGKQKIYSLNNYLEGVMREKLKICVLQDAE